MKIYIGFIEGCEGADAAYIGTSKENIEKELRELCEANGYPTEFAWVGEYEPTKEPEELHAYDWR